MPPPWSDEQRIVQQTFRVFAERELIPGVAHRDQSAEYAAHLIAWLGELSPRVLRLYEGTSQIQLLTIARALASRFDQLGKCGLGRWAGSKARDRREEARGRWS